ncbi:MAG: xanthine dehydrogenase family protein molybdopterin-binding subunit, partial [Nitrospinota bacterium]
MEIPEPKRKWVGESIKRSEDPRFLTGRGQYIDDIQLPGLCHAACLRSPHAHARIKRIDTSKALALPGVLAVLTGQDCKRDTDPIGGPVRMYVLTPEKVRHVGEYVAAVVAESRYVAEDACDLIEVDYEVLPPVMDAEEAIKPGASLLHEEHGSNLLFHKVVTHGDVDKDFASADHVFKGRFHWTRSLGASLETYGAVASYNPSTGILDIWSGSQGYFFTIPASQALRLPKNRIRAHMVDIGGGFGNKLVSKGMILTGYLALKTGRPVKFIEDRIDNLSSNDGHGEERWHEIELAVTQEGIFKSLKMKLVEDQGAYCSWGGPIATLNALAQITGPYKIGSVRVDMAQAVTNKCGQSVYRGVGNAFYFSLERTVERAARALKMDVAEIRQKNFIQPDEFPYTIPTGNIYDSGNPPACLNKLLENAGYKKLREEQARLRKEGKYMGIGLASMQGRSVFSMVETWLHVDNPAFPLTSSPASTTIRVDGFGNFIVTLNFPTQGQAHETTIQQLVADEFSIEPGSISVVRPDSLNAAPTVAV